MRYESTDTEEFRIELPAVAEQIGDTASLVRRLLGDEALLAELSETVAGPLQKKGLLADGLNFTLVPRVYDRPRTEADLFVTGLGPQPEPPDLDASAGRIACPPKSVPRLAATVEFRNLGHPYIADTTPLLCCAFIQNNYQSRSLMDKAGLTKPPRIEKPLFLYKRSTLWNLGHPYIADTTPLLCCAFIQNNYQSRSLMDKAGLAKPPRIGNPLFLHN